MTLREKQNKTIKINLIREKADVVTAFKAGDKGKKEKRKEFPLTAERRHTNTHKKKHACLLSVKTTCTVVKKKKECEREREAEEENERGERGDRQEKGERKLSNTQSSLSGTSNSDTTSTVIIIITVIVVSSLHEQRR